MSTIDKAMNAVDNVTENAVSRGKAVAEKVLSRAARASKPVTVTISRPRDEVAQLWRDESKLAQVLGEVASVTQPKPNRFRWTVHVPGGNDVVWETQLIESGDGLRFTGLRNGAAETAPEVSVALRQAPNDLGTEVTLILQLPVPAILLRGAAFKVLYRARALLQTGEIPTLTPTPAARPGNR
jgi:uncharacterized membrane protein